MVSAYVRVTHDLIPDEVHPATVIEESTDPGEPSIIDVPDFGLYAVGVHPELGPLGMYVIPTPGADPEPARARIIDGRMEVTLLADRITLVVEGHPLTPRSSGVEPPDAASAAAPGIEPGLATRAGQPHPIGVAQPTPEEGVAHSAGSD